MSITTPCENTVILAANAGLKVLQNFNIDPGEIGMLVVGTESGVDHSNPIATYVHQTLGLRTKNCNR